MGGTFTVSADVSNRGNVPAEEVVQLYVRDLVGNVTRPVKELKGFRRVRIEPRITSYNVCYTKLLRLAPGARIYLEQDRHGPEPHLPADWTILKSKTAGNVRYSLAQAGG